MAATGHINAITAPKAAATEETYASGRSLPTSTAAAAVKFMPDSMPVGVARIVNGAKRLFEVRTMQEHDDLMRDLLAHDVVYDAPPIMIDNREDMRIAVYLAKSIASLTLRPNLITVQPIGHSRTIVEVQGVCYVMPKRSWLVWPSLLLPRSIGINATIRLGVKGPLESGKVELIDGQWHNLPRLPTIIREFNGLMMGTLPRLTLPLWSWTLEFVGDDYYKRVGQRRAADRKFD